MQKQHSKITEKIPQEAHLKVANLSIFFDILKVAKKYFRTKNSALMGFYF